MACPACLQQDLAAGWDSCRTPEGGTADTALERSHRLWPEQRIWGKCCRNEAPSNGTPGRVAGFREPKAISVKRQGSLDASGVRLRERPGASSSTGKLVILLITESDCAKLWKLADYCKPPKRMSLAGGLKVSIAEECLALAGQYGKLGCFLLKMGKTLPSQPFSVCLGSAGWGELLVSLAFLSDGE